MGRTMQEETQSAATADGRVKERASTPRRIRKVAPDTLEQALDLWWAGCGGALTSAIALNSDYRADGGVDYPYIVYLHLEKFFEIVPKGWRDLAWWATENVYRMRDYPVWLTTPDRLFAMQMGEALRWPPAMRGRVLYGHLRCLLSTWLEKNPIPERTLETIEE